MLRCTGSFATPPVSVVRTLDLILACALNSTQAVSSRQPAPLLSFRFSVSNDLKYDAERDLKDIDAPNIPVHALNKVGRRIQDLFPGAEACCWQWVDEMVLSKACDSDVLAFGSCSCYRQ